MLTFNFGLFKTKYIIMVHFCLLLFLVLIAKSITDSGSFQANLSQKSTNKRVLKKLILTNHNMRKKQFFTIPTI